MRGPAATPEATWASPAAELRRAAAAEPARTGRTATETTGTWSRRTAPESAGTLATAKATGIALRRAELLPRRDDPWRGPLHLRPRLEVGLHARLRRTTGLGRRRLATLLQPLPGKWSRALLHGFPSAGRSSLAAMLRAPARTQGVGAHVRRATSGHGKPSRAAPRGLFCGPPARPGRTASLARPGATTPGAGSAWPAAPGSALRLPPAPARPPRCSVFSPPGAVRAARSCCGVVMPRSRSALLRASAATGNAPRQHLPPHRSRRRAGQGRPRGRRLQAERRPRTPGGCCWNRSGGHRARRRRSPRRSNCSADKTRRAAGRNSPAAARRPAPAGRTGRQAAAAAAGR